MPQMEFNSGRYLFVTPAGKPMQFSMRSCKEHYELNELIPKWGGHFSSDRGPYTIRFWPSGETCPEKYGEYYSPKYINDCIESKTILPLKSYRVTKKSSYVEPVEVMEVLFQQKCWQDLQPLPIRDRSPDSPDEFAQFDKPSRPEKKKRPRGRPYSDKEKWSIIEYIMNKHCYNQCKGRKMWQQMVEAKICPGRTWQSLKEQYVKHIIRDIDSYKVDEDIKTRILFVFGGEANKTQEMKEEEDRGECIRCGQPHDDNEVCGTLELLPADTSLSPSTTRYPTTPRYSTTPRSHSPSSNAVTSPATSTQPGTTRSPSSAVKLKRSPYTVKEDMKILQYINDNEAFSEVKGRDFWQRMEKDDIVQTRTWQSLKERFRMRILPNIKRFNLPEDLLGKFK
ncbi:uncharacterized protein LOC121863567 isoform X1 [Homarus americanus]|uniref:uncharacterized protein LOC121863567 isoform X1 n=1 Tax=Homarus americanus TaxID=6706 RepID=UPI001C43DFD3|nr:uncharacterized protein LOC121863567 isoform X1 [Homarus americanus]